MKSRFFLLAACFVAAFAQAQNVQLALKLESGKAYKLAVESQTTIAQEIMGQKTNTVMKSLTTTSYLPQAIGKKSMVLEARFEHLLFTTQTPQGNMEFQSGKDDAKDLFSTLLTAMINKPFAVEVGMDGRVVSVVGIQEILTEALKKYPNLSLAQIERIKTPILNAFGETIHQSVLNLLTASAPGKSVAKGATWLDKFPVQSVVATLAKATFKLSDVTESQWTVNNTASLVIADKKKADASLGTAMKYDLTGTLNAEVQLDAKSGWAKAATITEDLSGLASMDATTQLPNGLSIPTTIKTSLTVKQP